MQIDIKTQGIEPVRPAYDHLVRRLGPRKLPNRYQEATYDLQDEATFHYLPLWDEGRQIFDPGRTAVAMADWYDLLDPRQYYYGSWTLARARQQEHTEHAFAFAEEQGAFAGLDGEAVAALTRYLLPFRHVEYGANLNNCYLTAYGYGAAFTNAAMFATVDRLAMAQYLSRIGLLLDGGSAAALDEAKAHWMDAPEWQPLRRLMEELLVVEDWFELFVAQDVVLDGLMYPLVYGEFDTRLATATGPVLTLLTAFMREWAREHGRWTGAVTKRAVAESPHNATLIGGWLDRWHPPCHDTLATLTRAAFGDRAAAMMTAADDAFNHHARQRFGLAPTAHSTTPGDRP